MKQAGAISVAGSRAAGVFVLACALSLVLLLAALPSASFAASAADAAADSSGEDGIDFRRFVTVRFAEGTSAEQRSAARARVGAQFETALLGANLQQVSLPSREAAEDAAGTLEAFRQVDYAVASGIWEADAGYPTPFNDPFFPRQWSLANYGQIYMSQFIGGSFQEVRGAAGADIGAVSAWGAVDPGQLASETIGVIDTGVAYQHEDLAANTVPGVDFFGIDQDPRDPNGHGTHVASIAAGVGGNSVGTVGVNPWAKVMPLRAADRFGSFSWAAIEQSVAHGIEHGVRVFNGSFGGPENNPAFAELIDANRQALFVFSSGNGGSDGVGDNHDAESGADRRFPCDLGMPNVICVGASTPQDAIAGFSDYGVSSVDLVAPGVNIYAAKPCQSPASGPADQGECPFSASDPSAPLGLGGGRHAFQLLSGTSMAAPAAAGAVSLVWAKCPALRASQVKRFVVGSVDRFAGLQGKVAWGGRLDVGNAIAAVASCPAASDGNDWPVPPGQSPGPSIDGVGGGGGDGGAPKPPPKVDPPRSSTLSFQVIKPSRARLTRTRKISFKLKCNESCSADVHSRPSADGLSFRSSKLAVPRRGKGTKRIVVKLSATTARNAQLLLKARQKVRLKVTITVSDRFGIESDPLTFSIRLTR